MVHAGTIVDSRRSATRNNKEISVIQAWWKFIQKNKTLGCAQSAGPKLGDFLVLLGRSKSTTSALDLFSHTHAPILRHPRHTLIFFRSPVSPSSQSALTRMPAIAPAPYTPLTNATDVPGCTVTETDARPPGGA